MSDYPACTGCARPMRPARAKIADHPGTVPTHGKGVCSSCAKGHSPRVVREEVTAETVARIADLASKGLSDALIGEAVGRTKGAVCHIRKRHDIAAGRPANTGVLDDTLHARAVTRRRKSRNEWATLTVAENEQAVCRDVDPELFFVPSGHIKPEDEADRIARAKAVCAACPVSARCLEVALANREAHGVFGGLTEDERARLGRRRKAVAA